MDKVRVEYWVHERVAIARYYAAVNAPGYFDEELVGVMRVVTSERELPQVHWGMFEVLPMSFDLRTPPLSVRALLYQYHSLRRKQLGLHYADEVVIPIGQTRALERGTLLQQLYALQRDDLIPTAAVEDDTGTTVGHLGAYLKLVSGVAEAAVQMGTVVKDCVQVDHCALIEEHYVHQQIVEWAESGRWCPPVQPVPKDVAQLVANVIVKEFH